jgi:hypothetical protein
MPARSIHPARPNPEDLEAASREAEHAVLERHRKGRVPLVLWRDGRVLKLEASDPRARTPIAAAHRPAGDLHPPS